MTSSISGTTSLPQIVEKYVLQAHDMITIRNHRSTGQKGGVAFLVKHGLVINKEYRNSDFSIITENEAILTFLTTKTLLWQPFTPGGGVAGTSIVK